MIVGTAGHIDHGKSTLVEALTGQTMDRLADEQRRGITIDLNFAALDLGDGRRVGIIDVPGHEDFVRTMVAGASGIDLVLLVVAADEGLMPQTHEHLAVAEQLGVHPGVVVRVEMHLVDGEAVVAFFLKTDGVFDDGLDLGQFSVGIRLEGHLGPGLFEAVGGHHDHLFIIEDDRDAQGVDGAEAFFGPFPRPAQLVIAYGRIGIDGAVIAFLFHALFADDRRAFGIDHLALGDQTGEV